MEHDGLSNVVVIIKEEGEPESSNPEKNVEYARFIHDHVYRGSESSEDWSASYPSKWTSSIIKILLAERLGKEEEFNRPACKKKKLWQDISKSLEQKTGCCFDAESCDIKYRNLLTTYRNNKKRQQQIGDSSINWEYFQQFDEVLGHKISRAPPPDKNVGDSLGSAKRQASSPASPSPSAESISGEDIPINEVTLEKKKFKRDISEYFAIKLKKDMEHRKEQMEFRKEQLRLKEKIWEEKKALKQKEIEAILQLAKAMTEKKEKNKK